MPELPEVETVRSTLQPKVTGLTINEVQVLLPKVIRSPEAGEFKEKAAGKKVLRTARRGKYLLLHLTGGLTLVFHLRMTGRLVVCPPGEPVAKHTHVIFTLNGGTQLRFADTCLLYTSPSPRD